LSIGILLAFAAFASVPASAATASGTVAVNRHVSSFSELDVRYRRKRYCARRHRHIGARLSRFGAVQAYGGSVPANVTKTVNGTTSWKLATPFDIVVEVANQTSANYTLTAALNAAERRKHMGSRCHVRPLRPHLLQPLVLTAAPAYTLTLTIPFSAAPGPSATR